MNLFSITSNQSVAPLEEVLSRMKIVETATAEAKIKLKKKFKTNYTYYCRKSVHLLNFLVEIG